MMMSDLGNYSSDWSILKLSEVGTFSKGKGITKAELVSEGLPCIRYGEIYTVHHHVVKKFHSFINHETAKNSRRLNFNDLLFAGSGETLEDIGKAVGYCLSDKAYAGGDVVILSVLEKYRADYIACFLNSVGRSQLNKLGAGNSIVHIYARDLAKVKVALPCKKKQDEIVFILQTWDTAIEKIEALIAAKQHQFDWLVTRYINKSKHKKIQLSNFILEVSMRNKGNKIDRVLSVTNHSGFVLPEDQFERRVASLDLSNYKIVSNGEYAYNPSRINVGSIGRLDVWDKGVLSPMYTVFKLDFEQIDSDYFLYWLSSNEAKQRIKQSAQGSVRETVNFNSLGVIMIPLPNIVKQKKISNTLNTAKQEIDLLKSIAKQYRTQKRGLMQKLLTGKWRV